MPQPHIVQRDVRLYIYAQFIDTSTAPSVADTAAALGHSVEDVEAAYRALAEARAIVLRPDSTTIWMAMPFSNVQTPFTVISGGRAYYANCAWDAFGIAALLPQAARIFTTCADCGGAVERKISNGALADTRGVVHFALPPRRWWDDIGFTCATILLFGAEEHVDRWCEKRGVARGALVSLEQTWALARIWNENRLDPEWRRLSPAEASDAFARAGLTGEFWRLP
jgi:hypothetical protein